MARWMRIRSAPFASSRRSSAGGLYRPSSVAAKRRPIGQPGAMADKPLTGIALAAVAGGAVVTLIVGTVLAVASGSPFWLVAAVATIALNLGMIRIGRRRMTREHVATPTGRVLVAVTAQQGPTRWVGGANVPGSMGRMNATWPLAVLQLGGTEVTLDVRPPLLGRLFGIGGHPAMWPGRRP